MNELEEKLKYIDKPEIKSLKNGCANSIEELWNLLIKELIPNPNILKMWHNILIRYVNSEKPMFAISGYNSEPKEKYNDLRRGFLTDSNSFYYFFTDNFFAAYFAKMAIDNYVPNFQDFLNTILQRKFPSRFGPITKEEKELQAIHQGKDPGINGAGYKIAHIIPVGKDYIINSKSVNSSKILELYFPRGNRNDWNIVNDEFGDYYTRTINNNFNENLTYKIARAYFLRLVHPFNYILTPKKNLENNNVCSEIAEYQDLLNYAHNYFLQNYHDEYVEYLSYIMVDDKYYNILNYNNDMHINFGFNISINAEKYKEEPYLTITKSNVNQPIDNNIDFDKVYKMAIEYLRNPNTSFRKLETDILKIESPTRGGGFISKKALKSIGITADLKGILNYKKIEDLIASSNGKLKKTLEFIKDIIDKINN